MAIVSLLMIVFSMELAATVSGQGIASAPFDKCSTCTDTTNFNSFGNILTGAYSETQRPVLDNYWYCRLLRTSPRGPSGVWTTIDSQGVARNVRDRTGWILGQSSKCRNTIRSVCNGGAVEDNWVVTQFISVPQVANDITVTVNISYSFERRCSCDKKMALYYYPQSQTGTGYGVPSTDYILVQEFDQSSSQSSVSFQLPSNSHGFHIAFREQDSCASINRFQVYYTVCPGQSVGIVKFPETPTSNKTIVTDAQCADNAESTDTLQCTSTGEWVGNPTCSCNSGHMVDQDTCVACQPGSYLNAVTSTCHNCPANSMSTIAAANVCPCISDYFRASQDSPSSPCTGPPSCVEELAVTRETNTSVTICWQRPQTLGGRTDLTYHISHREVGTEDPIIDEVEDSGRPRYCHILRNLRPLSQFKIFVETVNSITEQFPNVAATSKGARVKLVIAHTLEGVPEVPSNVDAVQNVVLWKPPKNTNGNITGYRLMISDGRTTHQVNRGPNAFFHLVNHNGLSQTSDVTVRVCAKTSVGVGECSAPMPLELPQPGNSNCNMPPAPPVPAPVPFYCSDGRNGGCEQLCNQGIGRRQCMCMRGYRLAANGRNCTDVDECSRPNPPCKNGVCINTKGSFNCKCPPGTMLFFNNCKSIENINRGAGLFGRR